MREPTYPDHIRHALAASRQRADQTEQTARATATTCGWCGEPVTPGERCTKRMCQLEAMGDRPSDYRG